MAKVYNLKNSSGRGMVNQLVIKDGNKTTFQSYDSTIAILDEGNATLTIGKDWDYSATTRRWFYEFLRQNIGIVCKKANVEKMIANGHALGCIAVKVVYDSNMA